MLRKGGRQGASGGPSTHDDEVIGGEPRKLCRIADGVHVVSMRSMRGELEFGRLPVVYFSSCNNKTRELDGDRL